jgi:hypothetical protein
VVECTGACRLSCNDTNPCELTCLGGGSPISCTNGLLACGAC